MIQDFQQTTVASIGLLALTNTVFIFSASEVTTLWRYTNLLIIRQSSQLHRRASPAIAIQSKNCTAAVA